VALLLLLGAFTVTVSRPADAAPRQTSTGATIGVEVRLGGFSTPRELYENPCEDHPPFTERTSHVTPNYRTQDGVEFVAIESATPDGEEWSIYGDVAPVLITGEAWNATIKTHQVYVLGCRDPLTKRVMPSGAPAPGSVWVPLVSQETVVPALYAHLERYLRAPAVSFPGEDREFGWLYVNTAQDLRIEPPPTITLTASVTNITGSVSATITATPSGVTFSPGEPGGGTVDCSIDAATASYSVASPGCHYRYQHSSAISSTNQFGTRTVLRWDVTTSSAVFGAHSLPTISYDAVQVAEVQAVVTR
jgi:hypothetical protein